MQVITATSWNGTTFYYNSDKSRFDQANNVDLSANDHYESDEQTIPFAQEVADIHGLKNLKLETIEQ